MTSDVKSGTNFFYDSANPACIYTTDLGTCPIVDAADSAVVWGLFYIGVF